MPYSFDTQSSNGADSDNSQSLPLFPKGFEPMQNASPEFAVTFRKKADVPKPKRKGENINVKRRPLPGLNNTKPQSSQSINDSDAQMQRQINEIAKLVFASAKIVIIAGAGISVATGIQDFRSSTGAYAEYNKDMFHNSVYLSGEDNRLKSHLRMVTALWQRCQEASPTKFHYLAIELAQGGNLRRMYTQNFDGLEMRNDYLREKTIQLHGDINKAICSRCKTEYTLRPGMFQNIDNIATCLACPVLAKETAARSGYNLRQNLSGVLKPKLVLYGDPLFHQEATDKAIEDDFKAEPEVVIIAGTSMDTYVQGIRDIFNRFRKQGSTMIWVNISPPPQDIANAFDFQVLGTADSFAQDLLTWSKCGLWEITKWNLEILYPPSISFITRRVWEGKISKSERKLSEAEMLYYAEETVLRFWEEHGGRDQAIREKYQKLGQTAPFIIPRQVFEVLERSTDNIEYKGKERAYKIKWQGYPGSEWVPEKYVQVYSPTKLKEYLQKHERLGMN